jgi:hypothetical protein
MTVVNAYAQDLSTTYFWSGVSRRQNAMGRMPELTATADQALIRASKAHTGIRREIPVSVAREYGKCRSLTILGDFSDRLCLPLGPFHQECAVCIWL